MGTHEEGGGGRQVGRPARASKAKGFKGKRFVGYVRLLTTTAVLHTLGFSQVLRGMLRDTRLAPVRIHTHTYYKTCVVRLLYMYPQSETHTHASSALMLTPPPCRVACQRPPLHVCDTR
jgi:hypothetical protein